MMRGMRVLKAPISATLRRLKRDERGNSLILGAVAMLPLVGILGGGLDIARAYLVKARLNEACDTAALAGRKAMKNNNLATATPESVKFFNFNFPQRYMGSLPVTPAVSSPESGTVRVDANTQVPTTLMRIFGFDKIPVAVNCEATQNFDNIDIVLVLDTTGSMAGTKIAGLRSAVLALYDELQSAQDELKAQGLRLRYGIVPYSSAVNVGKVLRAENPNYILTGTWNYQTRSPNFTTSNGKQKFSSWTYKTAAYDISSYVAGGNLTAPVGDQGTNVSMTWAGCIEERQTTTSITSGSSAGSIPSSAYDLNINLIPSSTATKWKPYLAGPYPSYTSAEYYRTSSTQGNEMQKACPQQAMRLSDISRGSLSTYLDSLYPDGGTYHDIGMIWGARFISPDGVFSSGNPTRYNDRPVHRYIIFMTDGMLDTGDTLYSSYGIERLDKRVTGGFSSKSDQDGRHRTRFTMACNAAKEAGVSIWTIVFASGDDATLRNCASSDDQYALSADSQALIAKFKEIGKNIGALRLSK